MHWKEPWYHGSSFYRIEDCKLRSHAPRCKWNTRDLALLMSAPQMDESIWRVRESAKELDVSLHIASCGIQCDNHVWELRGYEEPFWDNDLKFPSSNMSVAFLDSSIENQKEWYIKPDWIKLLKYTFLWVAPLLSLSGTLSPLGSYCPSLPLHFPSCLHSDECHRSGWGHEICGW